MTATIYVIAAPSPGFTGTICMPARTDRRTGWLTRQVREYVCGQLTGNDTILIRASRERASAS